QTLTVTASSSDTNIVPNPTIDYTSPNDTGTLSFAPVTNANGVVTMTVTVNDGGASNNIATRTFHVTVNPVDDPPTISNIADQSIEEDLSTAPISFLVADVESISNLTFIVSSSNTGLVANA